MKKLENFTKPEFLICKNISNSEFESNRTWVYCVNALSLIEIICVDTFIDFQFKGVQARFDLEKDGFTSDYFAVFTQNNCEYTDNDPYEILQKAWEFYKKQF